MPVPTAAHPASFRDPSGYVFTDENGVLFRAVAPDYEPHYRALIDSGLYGRLTQDGLLVRHDELGSLENGGRLLRPERVPFVSYPYEWCFGQLKDAARATLKIQKLAIDAGLTLKDASAYNVQFVGKQPVLIDTLSFETLTPGAPWAAYRQFCEHFLAPLALMALVDIRLGQWLRLHPDGVPIDLAARLLPFKTRFSPGLYAHVHLHARQKTAPPARSAPLSGMRLPDGALARLVDTLDDTIAGLNYNPDGTEWASYYDDNNNYSDSAMDAKERLVDGMLAAIVSETDGANRSAWDFGANTGRFSRRASARGFSTVAWDIDPAAVERAWRDPKNESILPLLQDLTSPSPDLGWALSERDSLLKRGPVDVVLALALVHHLAIGANIPLPKVAEFFAHCARYLIVELVPKDDSQVTRLLSTRPDIFPNYTVEGFDDAFAAHFETLLAVPIDGSVRRLYLLRRRAEQADAT